MLALNSISKISSSLSKKIGWLSIVYLIYFGLNETTPAHERNVCKCLLCGETVAVKSNDQFINNISFSKLKLLAKQGTSLRALLEFIDRNTFLLVFLFEVLSLNEGFFHRINKSVTNFFPADKSADFSSHFKKRWKEESRKASALRLRH